MKQLRILWDKLKDIKATLVIGWLYFIGKPNGIDRIYILSIYKGGKLK